MALSISQISRKFRPGLVIAITILLPVGIASGQRLGPPTPHKPTVTMHGGGVDQNAPYRIPQRTVQGVVRDTNNKGVARAEVHLKDMETAYERVVLADDSGAYQFGGLPLDHDYEVWVQRDKLKTPFRPISSLVTTHDLEFDFRIEDLRTAKDKQTSAGTVTSQK